MNTLDLHIAEHQITNNGRCRQWLAAQWLYRSTTKPNQTKEVYNWTEHNPITNTHWSNSLIFVNICQCGEKNHYARTTCYSCQSDKSEGMTS